MTWPTGSISTANLDAATDSPALARADLLALAQAVNLMIGHGGTLPGEMKIFGGGAAPSGYLLCDGSAVSRTTYADLFAAIGTRWGAGDGSTTFNVPDMRSRVPMGALGGTTPVSDPMSVTITGNVTAGSNTITSVSSIVGVGRGMLIFSGLFPAGATITDVTANTIVVSANATTSGTGATLKPRWIDNGNVGATGGQVSRNQTAAELPAHTHTVAALATLNPSGGGSTTMAYQGGNVTMTTSSVGVGAALGVVQPSAAVLYIIKT